MAVYNVFIKKAVYKQLKNVPEIDYQKIMASIAALANDPRPLVAKSFIYTMLDAFIGKKK